MITPELLVYIRAELAKGRTQQAIHADLFLGGGWTEADLQEAFKEIIPLNSSSNNILVQQENRPQSDSFPKIYSLVSITGFTLLATPIFGAILLRQNLKDINHKKAGNIVLFISILYTAIFLLILIFFTKDSTGSNKGIGYIFSLIGNAGLIPVYRFYFSNGKYPYKKVTKPKIFLILIYIILFSLFFYGIYLKDTTNNAINYYQKGTTELQQGQYSGAIDDFNKAIATIPQSPYKKAALVELYSQRAIAEAASGDINTALEDINQSIGMDATNKASYIIRANIYDTQNNITSETSDLTTALSLDPQDNHTNSIIYLQLAIAELQQKDYTAGLNDVNKSISLDSTNKQAYYTRSEFYSRKNNNSAAIIDLTTGLSLDPNDTQDPNNGVFYLIRGIMEIGMSENILGCSDIASIKSADINKFPPTQIPIYQKLQALCRQKN